MAQETVSEGLNLYLVSPDTFVVQFVILVVILFILNRFVFQPYLAYLDTWEERQKKVEEDYNKADAILEAKRQEGDEILSQARAK